MKYTSALMFAAIFLSCGNASLDETTISSSLAITEDSIIIEKPIFCNETLTVGAARFDSYLDKLKGKKVGVVGNQSSMIGDVHLVDTLLSLGIDLIKVFSPEHGFRGKADAGEHVNSGIDDKTGLPIISLYGGNKKPYQAQIEDLDIILFDIQDVGARFYTYISTLHYVLEAAAENDKEVIILDRPNPNGHYVDGPVLKSQYNSFVGMHEVPVVHGMTVGEYAQMLKGEQWFAQAEQLNLTVVICEGWDHNEFYELPIAPSPNLPNMKSVYLYPSLCFFEGTFISIGRGTDIPFQCAGHPDFQVDVLGDLFSFTPAPNEGAKHPKLEATICHGYNMSDQEISKLRQDAKLDLSVLIEFYSKIGSDPAFFLENKFFNLLAGNASLMADIKARKTIEEIESSWKEDVIAFKLIRSQYLLYTDFE
jgi:uncharacterized protein YbbC (DUF1343 family)